MIKIAFMIDIC